MPFLSAHLGYTTDYYYKEGVKTSPFVVAKGSYTLVGEKGFIDGYPAQNKDGSINVVVVIPAGSNAKWEVDKTKEDLRWELNHGEPRVVQYLAYPVNYGMVPKTFSSKKAGGDGDPLNVLILGGAIPRGSVVAARLIGVLKLLDEGQKDDNLIAVTAHRPFQEVMSMKDLKKKFPGTTEILKIWFSYYKGAGNVKIIGYGSKRSAKKTLEFAIKEYKRKKTPQKKAYLSQPN